MTNARSNKLKYVEYCTKNNVPIFSQPFWLDIVTQENKMDWNVCLIEKNNEIIGTMPYCTSTYLKKFKQILMPPLTPYLGPVIKYPDTKKKYSLRSFEKEIFDQVISQLPKVDFMSQDFGIEIKNWLPFYWNNFKQTTKYTYIITQKSENEDFFASIKSNIRREIKKAKKSLSVRNGTINELFKLISCTFERQKIKNPISQSLIQQLVKATTDKGLGEIIIAYDDKGRLHAGAFIVWDKNKSYYLIGGGDPELRNSGGHSLTLWTALINSLKQNRDFDFEAQ